MYWSYLLPTISSLPVGYDCTLPIPIGLLGRRVKLASALVRADYKVFCEGKVVEVGEHKLTFSDGKFIGENAPIITIRDLGDKYGGCSGFVEVSISSVDRAPVFELKSPPGFYAIYSKQGKKSFFSDNAYKYGAPPVISQIAKFGRYVDGYPVVHLDRSADLAESAILINPYQRPILATILSHDSRSLKKRKIPPLSARTINLLELLRPGEDHWFGQIQITATNRLITFSLKHSFKDPHVISDHEHMDPFRADPTHIPAFQLLRQHLGKLITT